MTTKNIIKILLISILFYVNNLSAQQCGADSMLNEMRITDPLFDLKFSQMNLQIKDYVDNTLIPGGGNQISGTNPYMIPVVVHLLYPTSGASISYAQVLSAINALNADFSKDPSLPHSPWAVNTNIQFCLAKTTFGTPTWSGGPAEPGVMRYPLTNGYQITPFTNAGGNQLLSVTHSTGLANHFPFNMYLNIWVVEQIGSNNSIKGYATFPQSNNWTLDGIVIRADVFGDNSFGGSFPLDVNFDQGKTLAHEAGHYLNMFHIWQNFGGNSCEGTNGIGNATDACDLNGDFICDIAPCTTQQYSGSCSTPPNTCVENYSISLSPYNSTGNDMIENYMSYATQTCKNTFTQFQTYRMQATLNLIRNNLWTDLNLALTGVIGPNSCIAPLLLNNIEASTTLLCYPTNSTVTFSNPVGNYNTATQWSWSFPGGTANSSTNSAVTVTYTAVGIYTVTLTVSDGVTSRTNAIQITVSACGISDMTNGNWYFGNHAGLSFLSGIPTASTPSMIYADEACASISNPVNGALLFYTDGRKVWDSTHNLMAGLGGGLNGSPSSPNDPSANQGALIVPDPNNKTFPLTSHKYYIFTIPDAYLTTVITGPLSYSVVDMDLNGGLGQITILNAALPGSVPAPNVTEGLTAIPHCNGLDYWIIVHGASGTYNDKLIAYLLTTDGIQYADISNAYTVNPNPVYSNEFVANFAASPNCQRMSVISWAASVANKVMLYNFNNSTGHFSLYTSFVPFGMMSYSEFSPNSNMLFVQLSSTKLYQYNYSNMSSGTLTLPAGMTNINGHAMQMGPDGKIYFGGGNYGPLGLFQIGVINQPNLAVNSNACQATIYGPVLLPNTSGQIQHGAFPNSIDAIPPPLINPVFTATQQNGQCGLFDFNVPSCWQIYSQSWNFGDGITSTMLNPSHTYATAGTFTVTVTLTLGTHVLTTSQQVTVLLSSTPISILGPTSDCAPSIQTASYTATLIANVNYTWSATNGTVSSPNNDNNCLVSWNAPGIQMLTVTVNLNGCIVNSSINVTVSNCCTTSGLPNYLDPNYSNATISGQLFNINGTATISGNVSFVSCVIYMGPMSTIILDNNATLTLINTRIQACSDMWQGIYLNGTGCAITSSQSSIYDAENAIYAPNFRDIDITESAFDHNYISLNLNNGNFQTAIINNNNLFNCSGGYTLKAPRIGERSFNHIKLSQVQAIKVGDAGAIGNLFDNAEVGIYSENSTMSVYNNNFSNFSYNPITQSGVGILTSGATNTIIGGLNPGAKNTFNDNYMGIEIVQSRSIDVINNDFHNCGVAVFPVFNFSSGLNISDNTMDQVVSGVAAIWNAKARLTFERNHINTVDNNGNASAAIGIAEIYNLWGTSYATVKKNVIHSKGYAGIFLQNSESGLFEENRVYMDHTNTTDDVFGFRSENSFYNTFKCNEVDQNVGAPDFKTGFWFYDSYRNYVECNTEKDNAKGMQFIGNCSNYSISGNEMHNSADALIVGDFVNAVTTNVGPLQLNNNGKLPGNLWYGNIWETSTLFQPTQIDLWTQNPSGFPDYPDDNYSFGGSAILPSQQPGSLHQCPLCIIPTIAAPSGNEDGFNIGMAEQIAQSTLPFMNQDAITAWKAKRVLFENLHTDSAYLDSSFVLLAFYDSAKTENIGKMVDIKDMIFDAIDSATFNDSASLSNKINTAKGLNNLVSPDVLPEFNERTVNDIYLNSVALKRYKLTAQELSDLFMVANQCIYEGGPAVISARNFIHTQNPFIFFNDNDLCAYSSYRQGAQTGKNLDIKQEIFAKVIPNPVTDTFIIEYKINSDGILEIIDQMGKLIVRLIVSKDEQFIKMDANKFSNGLYNLHITTANSESLNGKFEVIK